MNKGPNERVEAMKKLGFTDFRNATSHRFDDISSELYREYVYADHTIRIDNPVALNVNYSSGGHRVWDAQGVSHYVQTGWKEIKWEVNKGDPHFVR